MIFQALGLLLAAISGSLQSENAKTATDAIETISAEQASRAYDPARNATADVDAAFARARLSRKRVIIAMGANWCHDSRAFALWMQSPRFRSAFEGAFEIVYVDIGTPQAGKGRNLDIARRFGFKKVKGTPLVMILEADGILLNKKFAPKFRMVESWGEDQLFRYLAQYQPQS